MNLNRLVLVVVIVTMIIADGCDCYFRNVITLNVKHKFVGKQKDLSAMKAHDTRRHSRLLSTVNVDIPLGGDGQAAGDGIYFAQLKIGNPVEDYHVAVDTASDIMWVNCVGCDKCPKKTNINIKLKQYDPKKSSASSLVYCNTEFCSWTYDDDEFSDCKPDQQCTYNITYADNDSSGGYFVKDTIQLQHMTGNFKTGATNGTIIFGCGTGYGNNKIENEVDGLIGFGKASISVISQLAASGRVKKSFAHCLDNEGGGIFTIGKVVAPEIKKTRMIPDKSLYKIQLKEIQIGDTIIKLSTSPLNSDDENGVVIDTGTTLSYLPTEIYKQITKKIISPTSLNLETKQNTYSCFKYDKSVDDEFPIIKFHFTDSLVLTVYPRDYLFKVGDETRCIGWMDSGGNALNVRQDLLLLGDFALSNKLVVYDIENQTIGWTEYKCNSNITVRDERAGKEHTVGAHNIGSASSFSIAKCLTLLSILISWLQFYM